jgi:hypothetical protein
MFNGIRIGIPQPGGAFFPSQISGLQAHYRADSGVYQDGAIQFTAADKEYLSIADNASLSTGDIDFAFAFWVYMDTVTTNRTIVSKAATSSQREYDFQVAINQFKFVVYNGTTTSGTLTHSTVISAGTWYFVVGYHDSVNNLIGISLNGAAFETSATTDVVKDSTAAFCVGANPDAGTLNYMNGRVDSLLFYKKVLSTDEVTWLYNSGAGRMVPDLYASDALAGITTSLISGWGFNEQTGTRYDYVGTNHLAENFGLLVTNGGFTGSSTGWVEGTGWGYSANTEVATAASGNLQQTTLVPTVGKLYSVQYVVTAYTGGTVRFALGGVNGTTRSSAATFQEYITATSTASLAIVPVTALTATIDNVSVIAAEIRGAAGIAKGVALDQNFGSYFNAAGDNLSFAHADVGTFTDADDFHVTCWFRPDSFIQVGDLTVFTKAGDFRLLCIARAAGTASTTLYWEVRNSTYFVNIGTITPGDWYFCSCKYDASTDTATFKINNVTSGTASAPGANSGGSAFVIGTNFGASTGGTVDSLGLWRGRMLTAAEETYLFNLGKGRKYAEIGIAGTDGSDLKTNLVDYWDLDQASGAAAVGAYAGISGTNTGVTQAPGVNYQEGIVSKWNDLSGNNRHLVQATNSKRPGYRTSQVNGKPAIIFPGVSESLKSPAFTLNQPTTVILVMNQITWTNGDTIFDGITGNLGNIFQNAVSPRLTVYAGLSAANNDNLTVGSYGFVLVEFNGASSALQINNTARTTGNAGTANMGGFTIGDYGNAGFASNIGVAEILIYNKILSAGEILLIKSYANRYALGL